MAIPGLSKTVGCNARLSLAVTHGHVVRNATHVLTAHAGGPDHRSDVGRWRNAPTRIRPEGDATIAQPGRPGCSVATLGLPACGGGGQGRGNHLASRSICQSTGACSAAASTQTQASNTKTVRLAATKIVWTKSLPFNGGAFDSAKFKRRAFSDVLFHARNTAGQAGEVPQADPQAAEGAQGGQSTRRVPTASGYHRAALDQGQVRELSRLRNPGLKMVRDRGEEPGRAIPGHGLDTVGGELE